MFGLISKGKKNSELNRFEYAKRFLLCKKTDNIQTYLTGGRANSYLKLIRGMQVIFKWILIF